LIAYLQQNYIQAKLIIALIFTIMYGIRKRKQIDFVEMIVDYLTLHGAMDAAILYESPFTDITPQGPDGLFTSTQVDELFSILEEVYTRAAA
jgi:type I site-specific restriction endonuclease